MSIWSKRLSVVLAALGLAIASAAFAQEPAVSRKGEGSLRKFWDSLELKPFDAANWSKLSDWTNGPALTPGDYNGKVVVVVTWSDWYPTSVRAVNLAKRLAEKHAKDGLTVVAIHAQQEWAQAKKPVADSKDAVFLVAHDANGQFRAAIKCDQDPDFLIIDRAGQLRYCSITTESVEPAVEYLLKEKTDEASGLNAKLAADAAAKDLEKRRTEAMRHGVDLTSLPEIPFTAPLPEAYKDIKWPKMPRDPNAQPEDPKNPDPPIIMNVPDVGFYPSKPQMTGRVVLMYFWHPEVRSTFEIMPLMDQLQKMYQRDLVVIGVVTPVKGPNNQEVKLENDPDHIQKRLDDFKRTYNLGHTFLIDLQGTLYTTASNKNSQGQANPWIAVVSSDNTLRWAGWLYLSEARGALDRTLTVDPGVVARHKAEEEYIRTKANK
jgi:thiol-disulfide isomerase/thioredoxin